MFPSARCQSVIIPEKKGTRATSDASSRRRLKVGWHLQPRALQHLACGRPVGGVSREHRSDELSRPGVKPLPVGLRTYDIFRNLFVACLACGIEGVVTLDLSASWTAREGRERRRGGATKKGAIRITFCCRVPGTCFVMNAVGASCVIQ